jgi:septum formation protein
MPSLILASSSPRRRDLLASLGIEFTVFKPDVDESQLPGEPPLDYVRRLSQQKAAAVAAQLPAPATVLAADTIVILAADTLGVDDSGEILGKPADSDDARQMLRRLRGRVHQVYTAITLRLQPVAGDSPARSLTSLTRTDVTMRDYTDTEIETYLATGDPFDKAGSYAIQHEGFHPVERIDGSYSNVVGLPLETVQAMLADIGWPDMNRVRGQGVGTSIVQE